MDEPAFLVGLGARRACGRRHAGKGRNIGVANARYDWIAFTDAGIRVEESWLERLIEGAERDNQIDVIYGSDEPAAETFFQRPVLWYPMWRRNG